MTGSRALEIAGRLGDLRLRILTTSLPPAGALLPGRVRARSSNSPPATSPRCPPIRSTSTSEPPVPVSVYNRFWLVASLAELGRFAEAARYEAEMLRLADADAACVHRRRGPLGRGHRLHHLKGDWATARSTGRARGRDGPDGEHRPPGCPVAAHLRLGILARSARRARRCAGSGRASSSTSVRRRGNCRPSRVAYSR